MFLLKKSGCIRFVTDFRELNLTVQRHPYPLPNVNDVLKKVEGFTHATCLDVNMGDVFESPNRGTVCMHCKIYSVMVMTRTARLSVGCC